VDEKEQTIGFHIDTIAMANCKQFLISFMCISRTHIKLTNNKDKSCDTALFQLRMFHNFGSGYQ
jgi:hypothetical protein